MNNLFKMPCYVGQTISNILNYIATLRVTFEREYVVGEMTYFGRQLRVFGLFRTPIIRLNDRFFRFSVGFGFVLVRQSEFLLGYRVGSVVVIDIVMNLSICWITFCKLIYPAGVLMDLCVTKR